MKVSCLIKNIMLTVLFFCVIIGILSNHCGDKKNQTLAYYCADLHGQDELMTERQILSNLINIQSKLMRLQPTTEFNQGQIDKTIESINRSADIVRSRIEQLMRLNQCVYPVIISPEKTIL